MARIETILILAACSPHGTPSRVRTAALTASCFDPVNYGAVPNDGITDRLAIQASADDAMAYSVAQPLDDGAPSPQVVCFDAGTWDCSRAPIGSYNRWSCAEVHRGDVTFAGMGPSTIVRLAGDQQLGDIVILSHDPGSRGGVRDLTVDTSAAFNTSEQTHEVGTTGVGNGPIGPLVYTRITFNHPPATDGHRKGDDIRVLGAVPPTAVTPGTNVYGVLIEDNDFNACARSGIQFQRGVHDGVIRRNRFHCDQPIHFEATGGTVGAHENTNVEVTDNDFYPTPLDPLAPAFTSDYDGEISGTGDPYDGIKWHGNRGSRGIWLARTANAEIYDTTISSTMLGSYGLIEVSNVCPGLHIHDVTLTRNGAVGPVIRLVPHVGICSDAKIENSTVVQGTPTHAIYTESASNVAIDRVAVSWTVPARAYSGVFSRATAAPVSGFAVSNSSISGLGGYGVTFAASPYPYNDGLSITDTTTTGPTTGCYCGGAGGFTAPVINTGNTMAPWACAAPH